MRNRLHPDGWLPLVALVLLLAPGLQARESPPPPPPPDGPVATAYDPCRLAERLARLFPVTNTTPRLADESACYRLRARKALMRWTGEVGIELKAATNAAGTAVYRIARRVEILGKRGEEQCEIDAASLLPLEHERHSERFIGKDQRETMLWDHLGGRLYLARYDVKDGRPVRQLRARVVRLGDEVPADAMDSQTAMLNFRISCMARGAIVPLEMYVYDGIGSRFAVTIRAAGDMTAPQSTCVGNSRMAPFEWKWRSLSDDPDRHLQGRLAIDFGALPVFFTMDLWGGAGEAELTSHAR